MCNQLSHPADTGCALLRCPYINMLINNKSLYDTKIVDSGLKYEKKSRANPSEYF